MKALLNALLDLLTGLLVKDNLRQAGASPESLKGALAGKFELPTGYSVSAEEERWRRDAVAFMRTQLGKGYLLGVEVKPGDEEDSPLWDCSEFTEAASRHASWSPALPDGAWQQYEVCRSITSPKAGDLGFLWSNKRNMIGHVFMYTGEGTVVHAVAGRGVVEDPVSQWENHPRFRGWRMPPCFVRDHGMAG